MSYFSQLLGNSLRFLLDTISLPVFSASSKQLSTGLPTSPIANIVLSYFVVSWNSYHKQISTFGMSEFKIHIREEVYWLCWGFYFEEEVVLGHTLCIFLASWVSQDHVLIYPGSVSVLLGLSFRDSTNFSISSSCFLVL